MKKFFTTTRIMKLLGVAFFVMINVFFYTLEAGGVGTGFEAAWDVHPLFGIFMSLIAAGPALGYTYFFIKDI